MWNFVAFLRDCWITLSNILDAYVFDIVGMNITLLDMLVGLLAMAIVMAVFWKGGRA